MRILAFGLCAVISLFSPADILGQDKSTVKFGKVLPEDFDLSKHNFDSSVSAVVISDIGTSEFEGNSNGWFTLVHKHKKRLKILNKNGFDASKITIQLYSNDKDEERMVNLKATTYNLENGIVIKSELDDKDVFKEKLSKNFLQKKFTFPAVKEGSIIEYSYTINSDFLFNLQPWVFQGEYPRIWSEYRVSLPQFFNYVSLTQGYNPYYLKKQTDRLESYHILIPGGTSSDNVVHIRGNVTDFQWIMKDVPALKEEAFTSTTKNHVSRIEFQLSQYRFPDMPVKDIMGNWYTVSEKMLQMEDFGLTIYKNNNWLDDDMKTIVAGATDTLQKARLIYLYIRDNFTCTNSSDVLLNHSLKTILKNKNGSVSDINLLLIAMLNHENIDADPVILSTRDHGFANSLYPLMNRFNYVIAEIRINGITYHLDASQPLLGFGRLPEECYNGYARLIAKEPFIRSFFSDSLKETKVTSVLINPDKGQFAGSFQTTPGYFESLNIRKKIRSKGEEEFFKNIKTTYNNDIEIMNTRIDSLKLTELPLSIHYEFTLNDMDQDIIYFNPMMGEGYKNNFFKSEERKYPVEMPYTMNETYYFNMFIPENYIIEEVPKSSKVSFNDNEGLFEYVINKSEAQIQLRSKIILKRANFEPEDYQALRDFFAYVVKKHSEQIVFKKKK